jgi:hypothetical protein
MVREDEITSRGCRFPLEGPCQKIPPYLPPGSHRHRPVKTFQLLAPPFFPDTFEKEEKGKESKNVSLISGLSCFFGSHRSVSRFSGRFPYLCAHPRIYGYNIQISYPKVAMVKLGVPLLHVPRSYLFCNAVNNTSLWQ